MMAVLRSVNLRVMLCGIAASGLVSLAALSGYAVAWHTGLEKLREAQQHRLDVLAADVDARLKRFSFLPSLLEITPYVFRLLETPTDADLRERVSQYLQGISATTGADMLYVIDQAGIARAAADWKEPGTPVGQDLSFRPYVRDALNGRQGRFYGVGVTSGRPGYYLSYALSQQGRQRGVATVKVNLEEVETTWRGLPGDVLLVDEHSVVILASRAPWKYRPLEPLDAEALQEAMQERRYGQAALQPLGWRVRESLQADARLLEVDGARQLASTRQLPENEWRLMALDDVTEVADSARNAAAMAALGCGVLLLLGIVGWMRGRAGRLERAIQVQLQAANDKLETKVLERTAELRAAQDELVHAGKMAALGQMSAGMVHELNQPLTAMRTLTDNAAVMLKRVSTEPMRLREVEANLARIARLVDRLGRLTGQLKSFAYKTETRRVPVDVAQVLDGARLLLGQRLQDEAVTLTVQVRPARLRVLGDASLLEQVMVNLMGNAIDAMAQAPRKELRVAAWVQQTRCLITVTDSGTGIRADMLTRLFEPFATTKVAGAGLGLGLMISAHLVRDLGGSLQGSNAEGGGACFTVELPCGDLDDSHGPE